MQKYPEDFTEEEKQLKDALDKLYADYNPVPSRPLDLSFMEVRPKKDRETLQTVKRLLEVDEDFQDFILDFMDLPPNVQLIIKELVREIL